MSVLRMFAAILFQKLLDYVLCTGVGEKQHRQRLRFEKRCKQKQKNRNENDLGKFHVCSGVEGMRSRRLSQITQI